MKINAVLASILLLSSLHSVAQRVYFPKTTRYQAQIGTYLSTGGYTPFWLKSNEFGIVPNYTPVATLRVGISSDYAKSISDSIVRQRKFDWGYGIEAVGNVGKTNQLLLPEAYVKARYRFIELYAGRRRQIVGLVDTTLTSGSYAWSGNTLPLPVIQIGTPGFVNLGFTHDFVAIFAFYNHGWFGNDRLVKESYLHQKVLYGRLGKPHSRMRFYAGLNHEVEWGGHSDFIQSSFSNNGYLPSSLRSYWKAVLAKRGSSLTDTSLSSFEENRIGNHLGSVDLAADINLGNFNLFLYRQSLYDDGSLFYLLNIKDGLNGIRLKNRRPERGFFTINEALVEFLYTKNQGGPLFIIEDPKQRGRDNYFNHAQYLDGWTYDNRTIGTPFLTAGRDPQGKYFSTAIVNNRVSMIHFGLSGNIGRVQWTGKVSYSDNLGIYQRELPANTTQWSSMVSLMAPVKLMDSEFQINATFAADYGKLYYNTTGVFLGIRKVVVTSR